MAPKRGPTGPPSAPGGDTEEEDEEPLASAYREAKGDMRGGLSARPGPTSLDPPEPASEEDEACA